MSTTEIYLTDEEITDFLERARKNQHTGELYRFGYEGQEYGICPFISFYILHQEQDFERIGKRMIELHQALEQLIDRPYQKVLKWRTEAWFKPGDKRLPTDLHAELLSDLKKGRSFWIQATTADNPGISATWAISAKVTNISASMRYTTLKITFRHEWYLQNQKTWQAFVRQWIAILQPDQCYSGFEIGTNPSSVLGAYESDVMERICADHFYGLDIDHPSKMGFHRRHDPDAWVNPARLGAGLRTPTWCFLLSPYWMNKLGLTEEGLYQAFAGHQVKIDQFDNGAQVSYWIQLGELSLYPVEEGVPPVLAAANRLIRPVRCNDLGLISLDPWEDDPNPRFDEDSSVRWMSRFDEDSDWPSPGVRHPPAPSAPTTPAPVPLMAYPGTACPQSGTWTTPAMLNPRSVAVKTGDTMPGPARDHSGNEVVWFLRQDP